VENIKHLFNFVPFPKMPRLSREAIVSEKIDGTSGCIFISDADESGKTTMMVGSRNRWISPDDDNHGFARWAYDHQAELMELGPGRHFGEWWGKGIQRGYGLKERRFSLFNVARWGVSRPNCCHVVPVLWSGNFEMIWIEDIMHNLAINGSVAAPGFTNPEGIVVFHTAANFGFKKTFEKDDCGKSFS